MKEQRFLKLFAIGAIIVLLILAYILGAVVMSAIQWAEDSQPTTIIEPTATAPAPALNLGTLEAVLWTPTPPPDYHATLEALLGASIP